MGNFPPSSPVPLASMHTQCSLFDVLSPPCLQMFYSDSFLSFFFFPCISSIPCLFVSYWIFPSSYSFFFLNPLKGFGFEFSKGVYKIQQWVLQIFLIEHELSRKRSLIRIFHIIFTLCFMKTVNPEKNHIAHLSMGSINCSRRNGGISKSMKTLPEGKSSV